MGGQSSDGGSTMPRAKIDVHASVELAAWASALHVTEQELTDAVAKVGDGAREVITYLMITHDDDGRPNST